MAFEPSSIALHLRTQRAKRLEVRRRVAQHRQQQQDKLSTALQRAADVKGQPQSFTAQSQQRHLRQQQAQMLAEGAGGADAPADDDAVPADDAAVLATLDPEVRRAHEALVRDLGLLGTATGAEARGAALAEARRLAILGCGAEVEDAFCGATDPLAALELDEATLNAAQPNGPVMGGTATGGTREEDAVPIPHSRYERLNHRWDVWIARAAAEGVQYARELADAGNHSA
jgi:hypothetical protein